MIKELKKKKKKEQAHFNPRNTFQFKWSDFTMRFYKKQLTVVSFKRIMTVEAAMKILWKFEISNIEWATWYDKDRNPHQIHPKVEEKIKIDHVESGLHESEF